MKSNENIGGIEEGDSSAIDNDWASLQNEDVKNPEKKAHDYGSVMENVLPYLTLGSLSDEEKTNLLNLSNSAIELATDDTKQINAFDFYDMFGAKIADTVGELEKWDDGFVPQKTQEARKLFTTAIFEEANRYSNPQGQEKIREAFFAMSPSFTSYCGELGGRLEMLDVAKRSGYSSGAQNLYGEVVYDYSFSETNEFDDLLKATASPIKQLQLVPVISDITRLCSPDDWNGILIDKVSVAFDNLEKDSNTTPLVKLVAKQMGREIDERIELETNAEWIDIDPNNPEHAKLLEDHRAKQAERDLAQAKIHQDFPNLPSDNYSVMIAPGVAGAFSGGRLDQIVDKNHRHASLLRYASDNDFNIGHETACLLGAAHDERVKELIDERLGLDLAEVPLDAQIQLLKFMTEAGNTRFDRLCNALHQVDDKSRLKLANGFLAADFGEDFGDGLLEIAGSERISGEQLEQILDSIESCRESIHGITELYAGFDDRRFANEYARAANERLTDAIMVFREIAKDGEAEADLGWFGEAKMDFDSALEALRLEEKSLGIINGTLGDVVIGKQGTFAETVLPPAYYSQFTLYNFYSPEHGYVMLYTRPEGSGTFDETIEYGKYRSKYDEHNNNAGVEASISLIVNPVDPFTLPKPYRPDRKKMRDFNYYDPSTMDKVSAIRLDREGRAPDAAVDDPDRNPMNAIGTISVDLAAINDRADTPSGKIARLFSVGNKIRGDMAGMDSTLNHNTHWFEQDRYGTAEGFKGLVEYIDSLASIWCAERKPSKDSESFRKLMQAFKREAGRAA